MKILEYRVCSEHSEQKYSQTSKGSTWTIKVSVKNWILETNLKEYMCMYIKINLCLVHTLNVLKIWLPKSYIWYTDVKESW